MDGIFSMVLASSWFPWSLTSHLVDLASVALDNPPPVTSSHCSWDFEHAHSSGHLTVVPLRCRAVLLCDSHFLPEQFVHILGKFVTLTSSLWPYPDSHVSIICQLMRHRASYASSGPHSLWCMQHISWILSTIHTARHSCVGQLLSGSWSNYLPSSHEKDDLLTAIAPHPNNCSGSLYNDSS